MGASDARPVPRKNTPFRYYFAIRKSDGTLITSWAGADGEVSLDGGAFADCTNEATEIGTSGCGYIDFTAGEMNADAVMYKLTVTNTGALPVVVSFFPEEAGDYRTNVEQWGGTAVASAVVPANAIQISGDGVAADNLEAALDGTGGVTIVAALTGNITGNLSGSVGSVTGAVGSVSGNVSGSVGSVATGGITAASFAASAIDAAALAADAANEIADAVLSRDVSNVEGSAGEHTLCTIVLASLESSRSSSTWTIKRTDGATNHVTKTLTLDASANPVTGVA